MPSSDPYKHKGCNGVHLKYVMGLIVEKASDAGPGKLSCETALSGFGDKWVKQVKAKAVMDLEAKKKKKAKKKKSSFLKRTFYLLLCFQISLRGQYNLPLGG